MSNTKLPKREFGGTEFPAEAGRYHLYAAFGCPFASRDLAVLKLRNISNEIVPVHFTQTKLKILSKEPLVRSWYFTDDVVDGIKVDDPLEHSKLLKELYDKSDPDYQGKYSVPVLWDSKTKKIVSNESIDIMVILNKYFNQFPGVNKLDLSPEQHKDEIKKLNEKIQENVNDGVYKCAFSKKQEDYEKHFESVFKVLDELDERLEHSRFLIKGSEHPLECDVRLFTSLIRFDSVYYVLFKCNKKRIVDYKNLSDWLRDVYQWPGISDTVKLGQIKEAYYSQEQFGGNGITPLGPDVDFDKKTNRATRHYH